MTNSKLIIEKIGPINYVNIDVNKFNIIIGEQSSGKSTIAKILSFCHWLEKDVAIHQSFEEYSNSHYFLNKICSFHNLFGFFNEKSRIFFESETIQFDFNIETISFNWKNKYAYKRSKISYIPSERSIVNFPTIKKLELPKNNVKSFLNDWFDAVRFFPKENKLPLLNLGVNFFYSVDNDQSIIELNDIKKELLLSSSSSGIQSITPILIFLKYLTDIIYKEEQKTSLEMDELSAKIKGNLYIDLVVEPYKKKYYKNDDINEYFFEIFKKIKKQDEQVLSDYYHFISIVENLFETKSTNLIIEEPEQNLFPSTQKYLIYELVKSIQSNPSNILTLTTHSPYILYAINNCILLSIVSDRLSKEDKSRLKCIESNIQPSDISIYEIKNGELICIQDEDGLISRNYFDEQMKFIMDEYYLMLNKF